MNQGVLTKVLFPGKKKARRRASPVFFCRDFATSYFEQESLTICTSVIFMCPCSALSFFM